MTTQLVSKYIHRADAVTKVFVTIYYTGSITFEINADGTHWETVALASGVTTEHLMAYPGTDIKYRITGTAGSKINSNDGIPGIKIRLVA